MRAMMVTLATLVVAAAPAAAQEVIAEVSTWDGTSWRLTETSFETLSTVLPDLTDPSARMPVMPAAPPSGSAAQSLLAFFDATKAPGREAQESRIAQTRRVRQLLTIFRGEVEVQVPLGAVAALAFAREPVLDSSLPTWLAADHVRHSVRVQLTDGSVIDGDYVNLGTTVLRGRAGERAVEIPWNAIQAVRFER